MGRCPAVATDGTGGRRPERGGRGTRVLGTCDAGGGRHRQINSLFAVAGRATGPVAREIENVENLQRRRGRRQLCIYIYR